MIKGDSYKGTKEEKTSLSKKEHFSKHSVKHVLSILPSRLFTRNLRIEIEIEVEPSYLIVLKRIKVMIR